MKRTKLRFANHEIEFINRETAIKQIEELANKGTWWPLVIYGPKGCGKSALLKQAIEVLKEHGYEVSYISPLSRAGEDKVVLTEGLRQLITGISSLLIGDAARLIDTAVELLYNAVRKRLTSRIALLADDVFQAIGLDKAETLVKGFLNMIEYPSVKYERIVVIVATSEGVTWERIGRHRWAEIKIMWNMPKEGFRELHNQLPNPKPDPEQAWKWTGGNPEMLEKLYRADWDINGIINDMIKDRKLDIMIKTLNKEQAQILKQAIEDPDVIYDEAARATPLMEKLIENNLIIRIWHREQRTWIDQPPPDRDPELGIGKYFAWQTPIHREAVKRALKN
ncbi:ATP-binding protein [Vulcanisaeta thermophila]|uniref:ATP-binding protein n=1 Tax=Vulcanisaeta thermophila TaxID=867917 RepID=UPI00085368AA|nr:ATP-binding protein [Vulcanisaeta thermophila]